MNQVITRRYWYNKNYYEIRKLWKTILSYCNVHDIKLDKKGFQKEFMEHFYKSTI